MRFPCFSSRQRFQILMWRNYLKALMRSIYLLARSANISGQFPDRNWASSPERLATSLADGFLGTSLLRSSIRVSRPGTHPSSNQTSRYWAKYTAKILRGALRMFGCFPAYGATSFFDTSNNDVSKHMGTEYICGMLLGSLIYDLAWWRWMEDRTRFPLIDACTRAPSWSWASVDGEINFPTDGTSLRNSRTFIKNIEIIRERNDLLKDHSRLKVQGVCMPIRVTWSEGDISEFSISELSACRFTTEGESGASGIDCDIPLEEMRGLERRGCILVLPLYSTTRFFYSLLIHRRRGRGSHRRIGLITIPVQVQTATEDMIDTGLAKADLKHWWRDKRPKAEDELFTHWNRKALRLIDHVESSTCRTIEIS